MSYLLENHTPRATEAPQREVKSKVEAWCLLTKCFDCNDFENRCYTDDSVISVCNKRNEVVNPEDTCAIRDKILEKWRRRKKNEC